MSGRNPTMQSTSEVVSAALVEHSANHGLEERQWLGVVVRAEVDSGLVVLVVTPAVTDVAIHPSVVEEVIALEHPVVLDDPVVLLADVGPEYGGRHLAVIGRGKVVADVVQQGADDGLLVLAGAVGTSGCLQ